jgi:hypothetical protein
VAELLYMAEKHLKNTKKLREKHVEEEEIRKRERVRGERRLPPPFLLNTTIKNSSDRSGRDDGHWQRWHMVERTEEMGGTTPWRADESG